MTQSWARRRFVCDGSGRKWVLVWVGFGLFGLGFVLFVGLLIHEMADKLVG